MSERAKPFVAHISPDAIDAAHRGDQTYYDLHLNIPRLNRHGSTAVVVTPLLPDDPRPGETWLDRDGDTVLIIAPPFASEGHFIPRVVVSYLHDGRETGAPQLVEIAHLRRPPVLKKFRFRTADTTWDHIVVAESKEAALKLLAGSLEEVEP